MTARNNAIIHRLLGDRSVSLAFNVEPPADCVCAGVCVYLVVSGLMPTGSCVYSSLRYDATMRPAGPKSPHRNRCSSLMSTSIFQYDQERLCCRASRCWGTSNLARTLFSRCLNSLRLTPRRVKDYGHHRRSITVCTSVASVILFRVNPLFQPTGKS